MSAALELQLRQHLAPITIPKTDPLYTFRNWARSYSSTPIAAFRPTSEEECATILQLAALEGRTVRAVGSGHSPSDLPCTKGFMIRMDKLNKLIDVNREKLLVTVQAGMTLQTLHEILGSEGLAMSNVGSISDTSIAVLALQLLLADGSRMHCSRSENRQLFLATLCGLGATGLIIRVTLQVERAFHLREVRKVMHIDDVIADIENISLSGEYVRLWWSPQTNLVSVMSANRTIEPPRDDSSWFWDVLVAGIFAEFIMFLGIWLPLFEWYGNVLRSHIGLRRATFVGRSDKILNVDCGFTQYTTEWNIPYSEIRPALAELRRWLDRAQRDPLHRGAWSSVPLEIRFSKGDDIWLSPAYGRTSCWIGIVKYKPYAFPRPFAEISRQFEDILIAHQGRPHWAKTHSFEPSTLRKHYPRFDDFLHVARSADPNGRFRNEYIRRHLFEEKGEEVCPSMYAKAF